MHEVTMYNQLQYLPSEYSTSCSYLQRPRYIYANTVNLNTNASTSSLEYDPDFAALSTMNMSAYFPCDPRMLLSQVGCSTTLRL